MNKDKWKEFFRKTWWAFIVLSLCVLGLVYSNKQEKKEKQEAAVELYEYLIQKMEYGYFEGQIDAMEGNIRIERHILNGDTIYVWLSSPWDPDSTGHVRQPTYNPEKK